MAATLWEQTKTPMNTAAISYQQRQINLAFNTLEAGVNEDGSALTTAQIKSWENRIKFCEAVIKAHQAG